MADAADGLGIIAGRGDLPRRIAEICRDRRRPYHVVALSGFAGDWATGHPHTEAPILAVGRILEALRSAGCGEVVMAGGVERPSVDPATLDTDPRQGMARFAPILGKGDDGLLQAVRALFEDEGFVIVAPGDVLDLHVRPGILGRTAPGGGHAADAAKGEAILSALSRLDVGQGCVVADGRVLGIETVQGTDALLAFVERTRELAQGAAGGVLVKRMKHGQDRQIDAPTIGPATIAAAARAGLEGLAIGAGEVQIIDRDTTVRAADRAGLFLWARE